MLVRKSSQEIILISVTSDIQYSDFLILNFMFTYFMLNFVHKSWPYMANIYRTFMKHLRYKVIWQSVLAHKPICGQWNMSSAWWREVLQANTDFHQLYQPLVGCAMVLLKKSTAHIPYHKSKKFSNGVNHCVWWTKKLQQLNLFFCSPKLQQWKSLSKECLPVENVHPCQTSAHLQ